MAKFLNNIDLRRSGSGLTLLEMLIVAACVALLVVPIFAVLRSGARTSREGMLRIDTTMEARRVLQQVRNDLKLACFEFKPSRSYEFENDMVVESGTAPYLNYTFLSFSPHFDLSNVIPGNSGVLLRRAARITYRLEAQTDPQKPFMKLTRVEQHLGETVRSTVLSDRVNFFEIKPLEIRNQWYYWITLQLIDTFQRTDTASMAPDRVTSGRGHGFLLADFYDIVYPEYFQAFWNNDRVTPNWHVDIGVVEN